MDKFKQKIGIFDSGIGGFSILHELMGKVPSVDIDYISDEAFAPYGEKSDSEIIERSMLITEMLLNRGCTLVVVACNTATAAAIAALRDEHENIPFVGVEPYINVLNHHSGIRRAAVITTEFTGNSVKFKELKKKIDPTSQIKQIAMPGLAQIVEDILDSGLKEEHKIRLARELKPLKNLNLSHLILGCTHYPLIAGLIQDELNVVTVSPGPHVANRVFDLLSSPQGPYCSNFSFMSTTTMQWELKTTEYLNSLLKFSTAEQDS